MIEHSLEESTLPLRKTKKMFYIPFILLQCSSSDSYTRNVTPLTGSARADMATAPLKFKDQMKASGQYMRQMKSYDWLIPEEDPGPLLGQGLPHAVQGPGVGPLGDIKAVRLHPGLDHIKGEDREPAEDTSEATSPELLHLTRL